MTPENIQRMQSVFDEVVAASPDERDAILDRCCGPDAGLRRFVTRMLDNDASSMGDFLNVPVVPPLTFDDRAAPPRHVGPYKIIDEIGRGGMGIVYEAEQESPRRKVALKVIRPGLVTQTTRRRFQHEAEILAHLQHPGIAQIFDATVASETSFDDRSRQSYIAMEFVRGDLLLNYASSHDLGIDERIDLILAICDAVQHAHQKGVIHRDLKPGNIIVGESGPKIVDFGVARAVLEDVNRISMHTEAGALLGTVAYMSPEQVDGDPMDVDVRSDVFALGVVAYQLLTGRHPIPLENCSLPQATRRIVENEPELAGQSNPQLRGDIEAILAKAMEKNRDARYASIADMAEDFRRHRRDEQITARRPSTIMQFVKFSRRNRGLVAGIALAMIALIAGTVATATFAIRERNQARIARQESERASQISSLLQQMLVSADPALALGRDVTVRDVLDIASQQLLSDDAPSDPAVAASMHATIGETYMELGFYDEALKHLIPAVDTYAVLDPSWMKKRVDTVLSLAEVYSYLGEYKRAVVYEREAVALAREWLGPESESTALALNNLAVTLSKIGEYEESESSAREAIALRRAHKSPNLHGLGASLANLGGHLATTGRYDEGETLLREALDIHERVLDPKHPTLASTLNSLGRLLHEKGQKSEAADLLQRSVDIRRDVQGQDHHEFAISLSNLAAVYQSMGRNSDAIGLLEEVTAVHRKNFGDVHPAVGISLINLGRGYMLLGESDRARKVYADGVEVLRAFFGDGHPQVALANHNVAVDLMHRGDVASAESKLRNALEILSTAMGDAHPHTAHIRNSLGSLLALTDKREEATTMLTKSLEDRIAALGSEHEMVGIAYAALSVVHLDNQDPQSASTAARRAIQILADSEVLKGDLTTAKLVLAESQLMLDEADSETIALIEDALVSLAELNAGPWMIADAESVKLACLARDTRHASETNALRTRLNSVSLDCATANHVPKCERAVKRIEQRLANLSASLSAE